MLKQKKTDYMVSLASGNMSDFKSDIHAYRQLWDNSHTRFDMKLNVTALAPKKHFLFYATAIKSLSWLCGCCQSTADKQSFKIQIYDHKPLAPQFVNVLTDLCLLILFLFVY